MTSSTGLAPAKPTNAHVVRGEVQGTHLGERDGDDADVARGLNAIETLLLREAAPLNSQHRLPGGAGCRTEG